jgi:hypothetical protein
MADPLMAGAPMPQDPAMTQGPAMQDPAAMQGEEVPTEQETVTFETMTAGLKEYIFGPATDKILAQLKEGKNPAQAAGNITLLLVQEAAKQAEAAQQEFDMDMLLGVATEVIDALMQLAQAGKVKIADPETFMAEALLTAVQGYAATTPPGSEEQAAAQEMLAQMQQDGTVEQGAAELQRLGQKAGVDPFAQAQPKEKPIAQGVRAGLMGG